MAVTSLIGRLDNLDGQLAHTKLLYTIRSAAVATGDWELLYPSGSANIPFILKGRGYPGTEEIYIGFSSFTNPTYTTSGIYVAGLTGYVPGNIFSAQPGLRQAILNCDTELMDYWINISPQRICGAVRMLSNAWQTFYVGFLNRYGLPSQFPYPMVVAGENNATTYNLNYNWSALSFPYKTQASTKVSMRNNMDWITPNIHPYSNAAMVNEITYRSRPGNTRTGDVFPLLPLILHNADGIYGELEGVYAGPAWGIELGDIIRHNGIDHILMGNITTIDSGTIALRMD